MNKLKQLREDEEAVLESAEWALQENERLLGEIIGKHTALEPFDAWSWAHDARQETRDALAKIALLKGES